MTAAEDRPPSLRNRQSERVRAELCDAFVRLATEHGVQGFSLHDVAVAAGVSDRTLYRYFGSRDALVEGVLEHATAVVEQARRDRDVSHDDGGALRHPDAVAGAFELFAEHADLVRVSAQLRESGAHHHDHERRTEAVREALADRGVGPEAVDGLTAIIRLLTGSEGWRHLTADHGLTSREAGLAAHWASQQLIRSAADHDGPLVPDPAPLDG